MSTISDFHLLLTSIHVPDDGSEVGGTTGVPTNPLFAQIVKPLLLGSTDLLFLANGTTKSGTQYPDAEFYPENGIPDEGYAGGPLTATWVFSAASDLSKAQALETTLIWIKNGYAYNGAFEIQMPLGGHILLSSFNEGWTDTKEVVGIPSSDVQHTLVISYNFDVAAKVRKVLSVTLDGKTLTIPAALQSAPATASTWTNDIFMPQLQLGQAEAGSMVAVTLHAGCSISF